MPSPFAPDGRIVKTWQAGRKLVDDAMKKEMKELQELKGIGKVLSQRLVKASYSTIARVAAAEESGLKRISGMNPQKVRSMVTQAREMTAASEKSRPKKWKDASRAQMDGTRF
jgi:predicted flap endonuclease-1-like 5' DNA nuclease